MPPEFVFVELYITREKTDSGYILKFDTETLAFGGNTQTDDYDDDISEDFRKELLDKYHIEID